MVDQFCENANYQYFFGMDAFTIKRPCVPTELVEFRHRVGEDGIELILKESIRVNLLLEDRKREEDDKRKQKDYFAMGILAIPSKDASVKIDDLIPQLHELRSSRRAASATATVNCRGLLHGELDSGLVQR